VLSRRVVDRRWKIINGALAASCLAVLMLLSLPVVGNTLLASLDRYPPISQDELKNAQAIVILGGGIYRDAPEYGGDTVGRSSLERLRYGVRLARGSKLPVLVSGGAPAGNRPEAELMRDALEQDFGIKARWVETASRNTSENASGSAPFLKRAGISRIVLVTHSWHLPRAVPLFEREGFVVIPAPTNFATYSMSDPQSFLPGDGSESRQAAREYLGLLFNHLFGAR
jgi:uncharacterized SAM-binding protein YcdF (DUF218 family)